MKKKYDAVVVGGSLGGVLAAYSLSKHNNNVLLIEETDWIGGQLTNQGVPSDEHIFIEETGATKTYRNYRNTVREYYRNHPNIIDKIKTKEIFNPGSGWVSKNAHEPTLAHRIFNEMLDPFIKQGNLDILLNSKVINAVTTPKSIISIDVLTENKTHHIKAAYFIDATDNGDFLPISKTNYFVGAESKKKFNEPHAPKIENKNDLQPVTWVAAIQYDQDGNHKIDKPEMYDHFKNIKMPYGPLLSWYGPGLDLNTHRLFSLFATPGSKFEDTPAMFTYRQIIDPERFKNKEGIYPTTLLNWPQNDYIFGNIIENDDAEYHKYAAKQLTLSLVYWLQTEAERCDGKGFGYPEITLAPEILGTKTGLAQAPYIRESRRIDALYTVVEQDINKRFAKVPPKYWDSVGIGLYHIDLHMTTETYTYFYDESWPFQIPLGALIPKDKDNLVAGCKNIGTTHITNGCYRTHPVEWNIGESAGLLISYCLKEKITPHQLYNNKEKVKAFQRFLETNGILLSWPEYVFKG